jgi:glyoxylase-like metal-dependent hydrolase (beta-lactamase superfamily II)
MDIDFDTRFTPEHGQAVPVAGDLVRVTANNPSPFTFHGTNSYLLGRETLAVFDPGPDDEAHLQALLAAIAGRPVSHVFVSHTHRDHSPLANRLKALTGAVVCAQGPHRLSRPLWNGESNAFEAAGDADFVPDHALGDGETVAGDGWSVRAIHTPGHCYNHLCFALEGTGALLSGDHVMAWSTSVVAPPDGSMADYMAALDKLLERDDAVFFPGHGGPVRAPQQFMRGLKAHRKMRERAILERVRQGDRTIPQVVKAIYRDTDPRLHGAAGLSVLAHLEDLASKGMISTDGAPALDGFYQPA